MFKALALILLAVEMGAGFGTASAESISTSSNAVEVDLRVEVTVEAESVVAHLIFAGRPELTIPMLEREPGVFGIRTELEPIDYQVVFEALGPEPARSEPRSLTTLGAELSADTAPGPTITTTAPDDPVSGEARNWLWLAVAFGAAALSALAFWALGGDDRPATDHSDEGPASGSTAESTGSADGAI